MTRTTRGSKYIEVNTASQDVQVNALADDLEKLGHGFYEMNFASNNDVTLGQDSSDEYQYANKCLKFTDTGALLTSGKNIIFPAADWAVVIWNDTDYTLTVKTSGGSGAAVLARETAVVVCDGTDFSKLSMGAKNNLSASTDPAAGDDIADGYTVNSVWHNTTKDWTWVCLDNTSAAAVWKRITNDAVSLNTQTASTYTLVMSDSGVYVRLTHSTNCELTVPANSSVAFPVGTLVYLRAGGDGTVTVSGAAGVTVNAPSGGTLVVPSDGTAFLCKVATDIWDMGGQVNAA